MGMAFADCRLAHNWVFFTVFHNIIRQSHRGKAGNFHIRSYKFSNVSLYLLFMYKHLLLSFRPFFFCG